MANWSDFEPYLRGDMLPLSKSITVTIERVQIEQTHPKANGPAVPTPVLYFKGKTKGMPLSTTNIRTLRALFGDNADNAIGKAIRIRAEKKQVAGRSTTPIYISAADEKAGDGEVEREP